MTIVITRDGKIKATLPRIDEKSDGTLWFQGQPLLAISNPTEKARVVKLVKAKKYNKIPAKHFAKMGDNPEGVWVGDAKDWQDHPLKKAADKKAEVIEAKREAEKAKEVKIYLSSRGWGDYSSVEWVGDITRPDAEILAECRNKLQSANDVDKADQADDEILASIRKARGVWTKAMNQKAAVQTKHNEVFANAKTTGERQSLDSWMTEECSENLDDCSFDHAVKWAMPDGTTTVTYQHCH